MKIFALLFLLGISLSLSAQKSNQPKYFPLGVCQKVENSQLVSTMGFDYIECGVENLLSPTQPEEVFETKLQMIHKYGLKLYACNSFIPATLKSVGPDAVPDKILEFAKTSFQRAKIAGIKIIVFGSGASRKIPDGFDRQKAREQFIDLLKKIGPLAKAYDVTIAIEPLRSQETNFINSVKEGCEIARVVNDKNIRVLADFYHMNCEKESAESIVQAGNLLVHCHVAETEKRAAPGTLKEDFTPFFKALHKINYKGKISIECGWVNFEKEAPEAIKILMNQQDGLINSKS
jgi:sugar phosphate isomerase/epimerase